MSGGRQTICRWRARLQIADRRETLSTRLLKGFGSLLLALPAVPAAAQDQFEDEIDTLARDVERVESLRAVKDVQRHYAQYAQFGLWDEMADLFARNGTLVWGDTRLSGRAAIAGFLRERLGGTRGMTAGAMHTEFIDDPLVNLAVDGTAAQGRWMFMTFAGNGAGDTLIEGGIFENDYVLEDGVWKIATLRYFPQFRGDYPNGWSNVGGGQLPQIGYHFSIDETGIPIPPAPGAAPDSDATLGELEARVALLNAEDAARNLHNTWGYYVDRRMWDDVVDLFAPDGTIEIAGAGEFSGAAGIRSAMERMGPQGLAQGDLNDHPLFDTIITVAPGAREADARAIMLGMLGNQSAGTAGWSFSVVSTRMELHEGLWRIRDMRITPLLQADYARGWGNGGTSSIDDVLPAFTEPHPVTGASVTVAGMVLDGGDPFTAPALSPAAGGGSALDTAGRLLEARRRLTRSHAYDGVVNVSSAYGYYLDDFQWQAMASIFAVDGNKHSPFAGFYLGQDRIRAAATAMYGPPPKRGPGSRSTGASSR